MSLKIKILGISGVARSGKDTFYSNMPKHVECQRLAFADQLKEECDDFLMKNTGVSVFSEEPSDKELIRPFLVTYGTHVRRKLDPLCWIKKIEEQADALIERGILPVITDVRYENEASWIHKKGGKLIHISRMIPIENSEEEGILPPANLEEAENDPILMKNSDATITWRTYGSEKTSQGQLPVKECLKNLQIIN